MNTQLRIVMIAVAVAVAAIVVWNLAQPAAIDVPPAAAQARVPNVEAPAQPDWFVATGPVAPVPAAEAPVEATVEPPAPEIAPETPADPNALTAETLKNTRWKEDNIDVVFMADGRWQMNGRICAKWEVEGDRVKIFDDKGEVHYCDIAGDSLEFNGKKIGKVDK